jgi:hypothetical protein
VEEAINQNMNKGALVFNYVGHGGETGLALERVVSIPMIQNWSNVNNMPIFISATCEFSRFDDPGRVSAGETTLTTPYGGAVGLLTTTRLVNIFVNTILVQNLYTEIFNELDGEPLALGEIIRRTKNLTLGSNNMRNFALLGDPALKLGKPRPQIITDSVNGVDITSDIDTLKALTKITIKGHVANAEGTLLSDYNGFVYPDVFDKWKQHYLSVRLDNSANPVYKHTYNLINILKQYNCTPLPADHDDVGEPGAITHLAGVESLAPTADYSKVIFVFSTRDKFWNNLSVDNAELGFYGMLFDFAQAENIDMNSTDWDQFLNDLHATVQGVYRTMNKLKSNASKAFKQYRFEQFTDKDGKGAGFTLSLYFAYQAYIKLGGKFVVKALKDLHVHKGVDALQYLEAKQITQINTHASASNQIVKRSIQLPKKAK